MPEEQLREALEALVEHLGSLPAVELRRVRLSFWPESNSVLVRAVDALAAVPSDRRLSEALEVARTGLQDIWRQDEGPDPVASFMVRRAAETLGAIDRLAPPGPRPEQSTEEERG